MNKKEIKKSLLSFFRKALLGLSVLCFIACFSYLIKYYVIEPYKNKNALETPSINESDTQTTMMANKSKHVLAKYKDLLEKNNDFVGILKIPLLDENDMKVVQGEDNEEYLYKNFNGEYSVYGTLFVDYRNKVDNFDTNTIIYGHKMRDGQIFGHLNYYQDIDNYKDYPIPDDLTAFKGDYRESYPDYLSAINRLDYNVGRLVEKLKELGIYDDTIIVYTSDHGSHFKTRNPEYKRSCHESAVHTPLIIKGGKFTGGRKETALTSLIDMPPTLLSMADIDIPSDYMGMDLAGDISKRKSVFIQVSEMSNSRAIRTQRYKYSVRDIAPIGYIHSKANVYFEDYLYDLEKDPNELNNLVKDKAYASVRAELKEMLKEQMRNADEKVPTILPAVITRRK